MPTQKKPSKRKRAQEVSEAPRKRKKLQTYSIAQIGKSFQPIPNDDTDMDKLWSEFNNIEQGTKVEASEEQKASDDSLSRMVDALLEDKPSECIEDKNEADELHGGDEASKEKTNDHTEAESCKKSPIHEKKYIGVCWDPLTQRWRLNRKSRCGKSIFKAFDDQVKAAKYGDEWIRENNIYSLRLNFPTEQEILKRRAILLKDFKHGYFGIKPHKNGVDWEAVRGIKKKAVYGGRFATKEEAARKSDELWRNANGDPAKINFPAGLSSKADGEAKAEDHNEQLSKQYKGITLNKSRDKWKVQIYDGKKTHYGGSYESQINAAHAANRLCKDLGLPLKNPDLGIPPENLNRAERKPILNQSKFIGVYRSSNKSKWRGCINVRGVYHYVGRYESDVDAAKAVNFKCDELSIPRKNPSVGSHKPNTDEYKGNATAVELEPQVNKPKLIGVCKRSMNTWEAQLSRNGVFYYLGCYKSDVDAAEAVNYKCDELKIARKNPSQGSQRPNTAEYKESAPVADNELIPNQSKFIGVCRGSSKTTWKGAIKVRGVYHYVGCYESDVDAAKAVNFKCDELSIPRKNPSVGSQTPNTDEYKDNAPAVEIEKKVQAAKSDIEIKYKCVTFQAGSWKAFFTHDGIPYYLGRHSTALEAAKAINCKCDELKIPRKNPSISDGNSNKKKKDSKPAETPKSGPQSKFKYVYKSTTSKNFNARMRHEGVDYYLGAYEDAKVAAMAVNYNCDELKIARPNPDVGAQKPNTVKSYRRDEKKKNKQISSPKVKAKTEARFRNVTYNKSKRAYFAKMNQEYLGYYKDSKSAAEAVNWKCDDLGIPRKNPSVGAIKPYVFTKDVIPSKVARIPQTKKLPKPRLDDKVKGKAETKFSNISYNKRNNKYYAKVNKEYLGCYKDSKSAAEAVNWKCDQLGISRKNPSVGAIKPYLFMKDVVASSTGTKSQTKKLQKPRLDLKVQEKAEAKFKNVTYNKNNNTYYANMKGEYLGCYKDGKSAAEAVNWQCDQVGIPRRNTSVGAKKPYIFMKDVVASSTDRKSPTKKRPKPRLDPKVQEKVEGKFKNITYCKTNNRYYANMKGEYLGCYKDGKSAAEAVNWQCDQIGIPRRNPSVGAQKPCVFMKDVVASSTYRKSPTKKRPKPRLEPKNPDSPPKRCGLKFVNWHRNVRKWQANFRTESGEMLYIGFFTDPNEAGRAINDKCRELGMPLVHPQLESDSLQSGGKLSSGKVKNSRKKRKPDLPFTPGKKSKKRPSISKAHSGKKRKVAKRNDPTKSKGIIVSVKKSILSSGSEHKSLPEVVNDEDSEDESRSSDIVLEESDDDILEKSAEWIIDRRGESTNIKDLDNSNDPPSANKKREQDSNEASPQKKSSKCDPSDHKDSACDNLTNDSNESSLKKALDPSRAESWTVAEVCTWLQNPEWKIPSEIVERVSDLRYEGKFFIRSSTSTDSFTDDPRWQTFLKYEIEKLYKAATEANGS